MSLNSLKPKLFIVKTVFQSWQDFSMMMDMTMLMLLEEVLVRPAGGAHPAVCVGPNAPVYWWHYSVKKAPSFGWDVKPRSWLSVIIKNPRMSFEKE